MFAVRNEFIKLQHNLNKIEELYSRLCLTLEQQQSFVEHTDSNVKKRVLSICMMY